MTDRVAELVDRIRAGHRVEREELRALLTVVDRGALLDALVAAADGPASRSFHRALGLLRDLDRAERRGDR
ncbi:MAG: hypothetical protein ACXVEF_11010 [Polyangiales bacterium]